MTIPKLSVSIMCVPKRMLMVKRQQAILTSYGVTPYISCDVKGRQLWASARRGWESYDPSATHHLQLQDDAGLCRDFIPGLYKLLEACPDAVIILFMTPRDKIVLARATNQHWIRCIGVCQGPAIMMPIHLLKNFLAWEKVNVRPDYYWDDGRVEMWSQLNEIPVWVALPNLIEHLCPMDNAAKIPRPYKISSWFIEKNSPLDIDWTLPTDPIVINERISHAYINDSCRKIPRTQL